VAHLGTTVRAAVSTAFVVTLLFALAVVFVLAVKQ
jgi:hypothetical protein